MNIHGTSLSPSFLCDAETAGRFYYWFGASGTRYIHSVYHPDACPSLPGAIYIRVRLHQGERQAIAAGLLSDDWMGDDFNDADEIHVHLMAKNNFARDRILADLKVGLGLSVWQDSACPGGFAEAETIPSEDRQHFRGYPRLEHSRTL